MPIIPVTGSFLLSHDSDTYLNQSLVSMQDDICPETSERLKCKHDTGRHTTAVEFKRPSTSLRYAIVSNVSEDRHAADGSGQCNTALHRNDINTNLSHTA